MLAGACIYLESRTVGPQPGHHALSLQQGELLAAQLLLSPGQFAFENRQLAIAILEDGVGAAEQGKLHLLVLRAGVDL